MKHQTNDSGRCEFVTRFKCAVCEHDLTLNTGHPHAGEKNSSGFNIHTTYFVDPCPKCKHLYAKPAKLIKEALYLIEKEDI